MKHILISIISDQTIPNLLIIQELKGQYDDQLFISTVKMEQEGRSEWIEKAAGLVPGAIPRIMVDESNWNDISQKLSGYLWPDDPVFTVNLTGGTKVMTLAVYSHFARTGNRIIYMPIGHNRYEELYPDPSAPSVLIRYRLNLNEYLPVHGIIFKKKDKPVMPFDQLQRVFRSFRNLNYDIDRLHAGYSGEWKNYYTGAWFEEYLYYKIRKDLNLSDNSIYMNVELMHFNQVNPSGKDKELDLVFTHENELYFIEAKVSIGKNNTKNLLDKIMFKLSAVNKHFGLRSHAHIITLADICQGSEIAMLNLSGKLKVLGISSVIDRNSLSEKNFSFESLINHEKTN